MTTFPVHWHQECAKNAERTLKDNERELFRLQQKIQVHRKELEEYNRQINEAISRGVTKFDRDKFSKRKPA